MGIERYDFAVHDTVGQGLCGARDLRKLGRPFQSVARAQRRLALFHAQLQAIAVQFNFVNPALGGRRSLNQGAQLRAG
jgi:hypothetical protein